MSRIQHQLVTVVSTMMPRDLRSPFQDSHQRVGSDNRQLTAHCFGRDRVVVEIESDVDGLCRPHGTHEIRGDSMGGCGQQAGLFFGEDLGDGAAVVARPAPPVRHLIAPQQCLPIAFGEGSEGAAGPEGFAYIANGTLDAPLLITGANLTGTWDENDNGRTTPSVAG